MKSKGFSAIYILLISLCIFVFVGIGYDRK